MNDEILIEETGINEEVVIGGDTIIYKNISDYNKLENKPRINDVVLIGNKSLDDLDIQHKGDYPEDKITNTELEEIFKNW